MCWTCPILQVASSPTEGKSRQNNICKYYSPSSHSNYAFVYSTVASVPFSQKMKSSFTASVALQKLIAGYKE